jgi:hypothetical protein
MDSLKKISVKEDVFWGIPRSIGTDAGNVACNLGKLEFGLNAISN